jgi:hypothetical protein
MAAGYEFNRLTKANGPYFGASFGMWFPQFNVGISNVSRDVVLNDTTVARSSNNKFTAGISLPLVFSPGVYHQDLTVSALYTTGKTQIDPKNDEYQNSDFNYATFRMSLINRRRVAYRQPLPSFGQRLDVSYIHQVTGTPIEQFYSGGDLLLPAIRPSNFLLLQGEVLLQEVTDGAIILRSDYMGARGFAYNYGQTQYKVGITYGFPLFYPDRGFGNVLYTRRIRLQPFFDYAYTNDEQAPDDILSSVGAELIFDFRFPPLSIGVRYSHLLSGYRGLADVLEFFVPSIRF